MNLDIYIPLSNTALLTRRDLMAAMREQAFNFGRYKLLAHEARVHGNGVIADLFEQTADEECLERFADLGEMLAAGEGAEPRTGGGFFEADAVYALFSQQANGNEGGPPATQRVDQPDYRQAHAFQDALARMQIMSWLAGPEQTRHCQ